MFSDHSGIERKINNKKLSGRIPKYLESKSVLNKPWLKEEIIKHVALDENTAFQNLSDAFKAGLSGKFTVLNTYVRKEGPQINDPSFHFKELKEKNGLNLK